MTRFSLRGSVATLLLAAGLVVATHWLVGSALADGGGKGGEDRVPNVPRFDGKSGEDRVPNVPRFDGQNGEDRVPNVFDLR